MLVWKMCIRLSELEFMSDIFEARLFDYDKLCCICFGIPTVNQKASARVMGQNEEQR